MTTSPVGVDTTRQNKEAFIAAFIQVGTVTHAAKEAGIARSLIYQWLEKDRDFVAAYDDAIGQRNDLIEAELHRRAITGIQKPITWQGQITGHYTEYSDTLLIFMAKGAMPDKYRERIETKHTGTINFRLVRDKPVLQLAAPVPELPAPPLVTTIDSPDLT